MQLQMVGCSHHTAAVEVRERLAFSPTQIGLALERFRTQFPRAEAVLLSTCNRVEVYTAAESAAEAPNHQQVAKFLADFHGLDFSAVFNDLQEHSHRDAVRHLFTVAASLDSMVLGEPQIVAQVKQAYQLAQDYHSAGPLTNHIFQTAFRVAKRVAHETTINERRISIPSVAVADFAKCIFEQFEDKNVLVIGAGDMGEETLRYLQAEGAWNITVTNRSFDRAEELGKRLGARVANWDQLDALLVAADMVVTTTGATQPIVTLEQFLAIETRRDQRPLFVLDLAIPRDFDPAIGERSGVFLYSIDDLQTVCARNRRQRDKELPAALIIIDEETDRFMSAQHHRSTNPVIQRLRGNWQDVREQELKRLFNKLPNLGEAEREEVRQSFERYGNKLLHLPLESLRDESRHGTPHGLIEALKRLFQLKD